MTRGEIWWIDFGLAYGSTPQGRRPAIIVQNDNFNASRILTTVVVPLTTNTMLAEHKNLINLLQICPRIQLPSLLKLVLWIKNVLLNGFLNFPQ